MDTYRFDLRSASATLVRGAAPTPAGGHFPQPDRTLRMDRGGLCHLCGRKATCRVEMHTPLWKAGPIMYGECCLGRAEESLRAEPPAPRAPVSGNKPGGVSRNLGVSRTLWLAFAASAGLGVLAAGLAHLMRAGLTPF